MTRRDKVKILRKAANLIEKTGTGLYELNKSTHFSCHAILICSGLYIHEMNDLRQDYINFFGNNFGQIGSEVTEETQLYRSLLLDLYAEILENGDEV